MMLRGLTRRWRPRSTGKVTLRSFCKEADFRHSLLLPQSAFPLRANAAKREHAVRTKYCEDLFAWQQRTLADQDAFVLHDGPPYANGRLHMGHFLNKVLKDIVNRYWVMQGKHVTYTPGWDCHGLPIELKATQALRTDEGEADAAAVCAQAHRFATHAMEMQRDEFRKWGVMGDWDNAYATYRADYENRELEVFQSMVSRQLIYKDVKPVHWSPVTRTALSEAELEYHDHTSPATLFTMHLSYIGNGLRQVGISKQHHSNLQAVLWTTTPWTIPANKAIAFDYQADYCIARPDLHKSPHADSLEWMRKQLNTVYKKKKNMEVARYTPEKGAELREQWEQEGAGEGAESFFESSASFDLQGHFLVAVDSLPFLEEQLNMPMEKVKTFPGWRLMDSACGHPIRKKWIPFIHGPHVKTSADTGTGLVHTAPGHGPDDYQICKPRRIDPYCPVNEDGVMYNPPGEAWELPESIAGTSVMDGTANKAVLSFLEDRLTLIRSYPYRHRYPHDWRSGTPVIFRATPQIFVDLESGLVERAVRACDSMEFRPPSGRDKLKSFLERRAEWCVSRQRKWGVPIPLVYHRDTDHPLLHPDLVEHIRKVLHEHASSGDVSVASVWWDLPLSTLCPPKLLGNVQRYMHMEEKEDGWGEPLDQPYIDDDGNLVLIKEGSGKQVGEAQFERFLRKSDDTLDVWFDSGCSWYATDQPPIDLVVEGSDQHRGWFQSSLLTRVASEMPHREFDDESQQLIAVTVGEDEQVDGHAAAILTHGFVLDADGRKMSKSLGNVIEPVHIIDGNRPAKKNKNKNKNKKKKNRKNKQKQGESKEEPVPEAEQGIAQLDDATDCSLAFPAYGADVLRMWSAMSDYTNDVTISPEKVARASDVIRRLRVTFKFLLGSLGDFDPDSDRVEYDQMSQLDQRIMNELNQLVAQCQKHYADYRFDLVARDVQWFERQVLSPLYLDVCRDRLYCEQADAPQRRACQTVLSYVLPALCQVLAPIIPFTCHDVYEHAGEVRSVFGEVQGGEEQPWTVFQHQWMGGSLPDVPEGAVPYKTAVDVRPGVTKLLSLAYQCAIASKEAEGASSVELKLPGSGEEDGSTTVPSWPAGPTYNVEASVELDSTQHADALQAEDASDPLRDFFGVSRVDLQTVPGQAGPDAVHFPKSALSTKQTGLQQAWAELNESGDGIDALCGVLQIQGDSEPVRVRVSAAQGDKCPRCWRYQGPLDEASGVCDRCTSVLA